MGLFKRGCLTLLAFCLASCSHHSKTALNAKDEALLKQTLRNSTRVFESDTLFTDLEASLQMPRNLQQALSFYQEQYRTKKIHNYDNLQKIAFKVLQEPILQNDLEAQMLSLYGVELANHPKLLSILEQALEAPYNIVQMSAIQILSKLPEDRANNLLTKGCASPFLDVAFMTAYILAERQHPEVFGIIESLAQKAPEECTEFFPPMLAMIDNAEALKQLRKFLSHPQDKVRVAAINAVAATKKTELLEDVRRLATQHNLLIQEACAHALGEMHDEASVAIVQKLAESPSDFVKLAALDALYKLGQQTAVSEIEMEMQKGNPYAATLLRNMPCDLSLLGALAEQTNNKTLALNAALTLLEKKDLRCLNTLAPLLTPQSLTAVLTLSSSPASTLFCAKYQHRGHLRAHERAQVEQSSLQLRKKLVEEISQLSEDTFLRVADLIVESDQNDLIPVVINQMMDLKTNRGKERLKQWQQKVGSPYVRAWSNLALLKLNEPGPWKENVIAWIKKKKYHQLVRLKDFTQLKRKRFIDPFEIDPMETSQLLIESYLAIAKKQDEESITTLLEALTDNPLKNKYALAGLLILSTQ